MVLLNEIELQVDSEAFGVEGEHTKNKIKGFFRSEAFGGQIELQVDSEAFA